MTFTGPTGSASYDLPPLRACDAKGDAPSSCRAEDGAPQASTCTLLGCGAKLEFDGEVGLALARRVGAKNFTMTLTCDGVVVDTEEVTPATGCAV